jgi:phospho-N-acetylmuramoyl-pentapeptide-transferase
VIAILASALVGLVVAILGTPLLIERQRERGVGQQVRDDGPSRHLVKAGTPTMGGIAIVAGTVLGWLVAHAHLGVTMSRGGLLLAGLTVASSGIGLVDDLLKVRNRRSLGLTKGGKFSLQVLVALVFAVLARYWVKVPPVLAVVRMGGAHVELGSVGWIVLAVFVVVGFSNAVNLTDGLDGLASGAAIFAFAALALMAYWIFRHPEIYRVPDALDLAVFAMSVVGAVAGFLWWNAPPARIFMGDVGSLGLGSALGGMALLLRIDVLLVLLGGLFVVETLSVMVQVFSFRLFHRRVLRMSPIHHHFELLGWPETTVLIRFWIVAGVCTALAVGVFYADFLSLGGLR